MSKPDWNKIKLEYLKGMSREEICKKFKVKYDTLDTQIKRGKWVELDRKIDRKTTDKLEENISDILAERQTKVIERQFRVSEKIMDFLETELDSPSKDLQKIYSIVTTLKDTIKINRQSVNLNDTVDMTLKGKVDLGLTPELDAALKILSERKRNR